MKPLRAMPWKTIGIVIGAAVLLLVTRLQLPALQLDLIEVRPEVEVSETELGTVLDLLLLKNTSGLRRSRIVRNSLDQPYRAGKVETFHADRCEVSQGDFSRFEQWQQLYPKRTKTAPQQPDDWVLKGENRYNRVLGRLDAPATGVGYYEAYAYCATAGGHLPDELQRTAMTNGTSQDSAPEGRLYPWGNAPTDKAWPYLDPQLNVAQRCDTHPEMATPLGLQGLGYGVLEWLRGKPDNPLYANVAGTYPQESPHALYSLNLVQPRLQPKIHRSDFIGFRCTWNQANKNLPWGGKAKTVKVPAGHIVSGVPNSRVAALVSTTAMENWAQTERQLRRYRQQREEGGQTSRALRVSRCEISRAQYRLFLLDPLVRLGFYAHPNQPDEHAYIPLHWEQQLQQPQLPLYGVDWWSAHAYANWVGGRLPNAEEWQDIATSHSLKAYPWGYEYDRNAAVTGDLARTELQMCASSENDYTDEQIADMAGNLSEWTASARQSNRGMRVQVKGGNYFLPGDKTSRLMHNLLVPPGYRAPSLGLRVVFDTR